MAKPQRECFAAAVAFARSEGIIPAPEPSHALAAVIVEPVGPESGTRPVPFDFNAQVRTLCARGYREVVLEIKGKGAYSHLKFEGGAHRGAPGGRRMLSTVKTVIVDEIHAIAGTKRGAHLALTLELGAPHYEAAHVRAQKKAGYDNGFQSWILWNPGSRYTVSALSPEGSSTASVK